MWAHKKRVTVTKTFRFKPNSDEYQRGLKSVQAGRMGQVVSTAPGRSTIVDFDGQQVVIPSRRLERVQERPITESKQGRRKATVQAVREEPSAPREDKGAKKQSDTPTNDDWNSELITLIANKLLVSGAAGVGTTTAVEIQLADLPSSMQEQIQALIQAKLDLRPRRFPKPLGRKA